MLSPKVLGVCATRTVQEAPSSGGSGYKGQLSTGLELWMDAVMLGSTLILYLSSASEHIYMKLVLPMGGLFFSCLQ